MTQEEIFKDAVMTQMSVVLNEKQMAVLNGVLNKQLSQVKFEEKNEIVTQEQNDENLINLYFALRSKKLSQKTLKIYMATLKDFKTVVNKPLSEVTSIDIELYLGLKSKTNSEVSLNNYLRELSAIFEWLKNKEYIQKNPCKNVEPFKTVGKPIDHLGVSECEMLRNGCVTARDRALFEFMRCTGLRVGELISVRISDIDFGKNQLLVYGQKTKEWRECWLDEIAMGYVKKYLAERNVSLDSDEYLFNGRTDGHMSESGISYVLKTIAKRGNVNRRVYVRLMRKTLATNVVKRGGSIEDASILLGHREQTVTGKHYAYKGADYKKNVFDKYVAVPC